MEWAGEASVEKLTRRVSGTATPIAELLPADGAPEPRRPLALLPERADPDKALAPASAERRPAVAGGSCGGLAACRPAERDVGAPVPGGPCGASRCAEPSSLRRGRRPGPDCLSRSFCALVPDGSREESLDEGATGEVADESLDEPSLDEPSLDEPSLDESSLDESLDESLDDGAESELALPAGASPAARCRRPADGAPASPAAEGRTSF